MTSCFPHGFIKRLQNYGSNRGFKTFKYVTQIDDSVESLFELKENFGDRLDQAFNKHGYLLMSETSKGNKVMPWVKRYCCYQRISKMLIAISFDAFTGKIGRVDVYEVKSCIPKVARWLDKEKKCKLLEIIDGNIMNGGEPENVLIVQAPSKEEEKLWLEIFGCTEVREIGCPLPKMDITFLNQAGFTFIELCVLELERRGLNEIGLHNLSGVRSRARDLLTQCLGLMSKYDGDDSRDCLVLTIGVCHTKTITTAMKIYLRSLIEPVTQAKNRKPLMLTAKLEYRDPNKAVAEVHDRINKLPLANYLMLRILILHLEKVASMSVLNQMTVSEIGKCYGPTILGYEMDKLEDLKEVKHCYRVVEMFIQNADAFFKGHKPNPRRPMNESVPRFVLESKFHQALVRRNIWLDDDSEDDETNQGRRVMRFLCPYNVNCDAGEVKDQASGGCSGGGAVSVAAAAAAKTAWMQSGIDNVAYRDVYN